MNTKERQAEATQALPEVMGDAFRAVFTTGEVAYKRAKDGSPLNTRDLPSDHRDFAARYTVIRPGSCRFVIMDQAVL